MGAGTEEVMVAAVDFMAGAVGFMAGAGGFIAAGLGGLGTGGSGGLAALGMEVPVTAIQPTTRAIRLHTAATTPRQQRARRLGSAIRLDQPSVPTFLQAA